MLVYNAAGPTSKELSDIRALMEAPMEKITIGSVTKRRNRPDSPGAYVTDKAGTTLNAIGLKNRGIRHYLETLPQTLAQTSKVIRVSIAGTTPDEYRDMAQKLIGIGITEIEINVSCPNVWRKGAQKRIPSYDPDALTRIIRSLDALRRTRTFDYKLSPVADPAQLESIAKILSHSRCIRGVVTTNTFPNAFADTIGLAGLGGSALRHIALGQVYQLRKLLPKRITLVGVGGISSKQHVEQFKAVGADEVQVGSHYFANGPNVFTKLQ